MHCCLLNIYYPKYGVYEKRAIVTVKKKKSKLKTKGQCSVQQSTRNYLTFIIELRKCDF